MAAEKPPTTVSMRDGCKFLRVSTYEFPKSESIYVVVEAFVSPPGEGDKPPSIWSAIMEGYYGRGGNPVVYKSEMIDKNDELGIMAARYRLEDMIPRIAEEFPTGYFLTPARTFT
jgi:hypothetical protein